MRLFAAQFGVWLPRTGRNRVSANMRTAAELAAIQLEARLRKTVMSTLISALLMFPLVLLAACGP